MIADHDGFDLFDTLGIQIMLIRIEDASPRPDPDTVTDIEPRLRAEMATVQKSLTPDSDVGARKRKDNDGTNVGTEPGIRTDLDVGSLGDRDMNAVLAPLGVDTLSDRQARTRRERKVRGRQIGADICGER